MKPIELINTKSAGIKTNSPFPLSMQKEAFQTDRNMFAKVKRNTYNHLHKHFCTRKVAIIYETPVIMSLSVMKGAILWIGWKE